MSGKMKMRGLGAAFAAAVAITAVTAPGAFAQTAAPAAQPMATPAAKPMAEPPKKHALPDEKIDAHIAELHIKLGITPVEEDKWKAVADEMRDNAATVSDLIRTREAGIGTMTAVDDMKSYQQIADAHADGLKKLIPLFSDLYDSFSDAQKKTADAVFSHGPEHGHKH